MSMIMRKYMVMAIALLLVGLGVSIRYGMRMQDKYTSATSNMKAYDDLLAGKAMDNHRLSLTLEQLKYSNDSLLNKLDSVRKASGIKENDIKEIYYITSEATKTDTLVFKDSVFVPMVEIDTLVGNEWYSLRVKAHSSSSMEITPKFRSSRYVLAHLSKETINPPKKCWLLRLFQRKHKVVRVTVIEENPYISIDTARYVEIVK